MGIWDGDIPAVKHPMVAFDSHMSYINSETSGIFIPNVKLSERVDAGMKIGKVVDVLTGSDQEIVYAPKSGMVCAIREYPSIEVGSLLARIVGGES